MEVVYHFVRLYEDGKPVIYRVTTGNHEGVILDKTKVNRIPFAAVTPYAVTHRFYGYSLADKLIEIQKIKTALIRMLLNAGYFAQNQRYEVAMPKANAWTLRDLMDNRPGQHVRVQEAGTVTPIPTGTLPINAFDSLEYVSTMGEQRSGIVRNAQGLNPDTLHDTASGAAQLISAAQKRIRYMARMFAETGVKDLYLLVHDLLRTHATKAMVTRIRGKFVATDPTKWASRENMCVAVGVGAGGRDHDLAMLTQILNQQEKVVQSQGGPDGPLVTPQNVYATLVKFASRAGFKAPEMFWTDPSSLPPQPPKPNPEMARVQAEAQVNQQRLALEQQKLQLDAGRRKRRWPCSNRSSRRRVSTRTPTASPAKAWRCPSSSSNRPWPCSTPRRAPRSPRKSCASSTARKLTLWLRKPTSRAISPTRTPSSKRRGSACPTSTTSRRCSPTPWLMLTQSKWT